MSDSPVETVNKILPKLPIFCISGVPFESTSKLGKIAGTIDSFIK
jgi:hypothetical protein